VLAVICLVLECLTPNGLLTSRLVAEVLDLTNNVELRHVRRDFDNSDSPSAVAYTPFGDLILVALQGNNQIVAIDSAGLLPVDTDGTTGSTLTSPAVLALDLSTGLAPQGLLLDAVSNRLFSQDFMGRSITARDAAPLLLENRTSLPLIATTSAVANELLSPQVLLGKQIFYNAADPRMSADSYISCATCHLDGGHDGRVWDFTGRGEGLRRTTDLRGRSGTGHGNVHWSGNFDEIQDFEHDIRGPFGGSGFIDVTPQQFAARHPSPASGKTGLSPELDALAVYVTSLSPSHLPRSPSRNINGTLTAAALRGQTVFSTQQCASCHSGEMLTNSSQGPIDSHALSNIGTHSTLSGSRLGQSLSGIDIGGSLFC
jgi:cytochrome c553